MNLERKGKVFLWTGVVMLALAGGVWVANGGIGRIKTALADDQSATSCSNPGCFSEKWKATKVFGLYRSIYDSAANKDAGTINDNNWWSAIGNLSCVWNTDANSSDLVSNWGKIRGSNDSGEGCSYISDVKIQAWSGTRTTYPGALDASAAYPTTVVEWVVNGHVH